MPSAGSSNGLPYDAAVTPRAEVDEVAWRMRPARGDSITTCALYRVAGSGVEVRSYHVDENDLLGSHRVVNVRTARQLAAEWREAMLAKGFVDVPGDPTM
jgi:hypothetical protein